MSFACRTFTLNISGTLYRKETWTWERGRTSHCHLPAVHRGWQDAQRAAMTMTNVPFMTVGIGLSLSTYTIEELTCHTGWITPFNLPPDRRDVLAITLVEADIRFIEPEVWKGDLTSVSVLISFSRILRHDYDAMTRPETAVPRPLDLVPSALHTERIRH